MRERPVQLPPALEVLTGHIEPGRIRVDPFDDDSRHVQ